MMEKIISNYKITSQIAEGGMGTVFYGEHLSLKRPVAIKQLNSNFTNNPHFRDRFVNEARILAQLNHPNIITIYDLIEGEGNFYIVMEYIQGDTIDNVMRNLRSPFELQRALNIFIPILKAFNYAHSKGIVHRDIKPSNIILNEKDDPKVLDFGIAKIIQGDLNLTKAGTKMGSLFYMSPEQVLGAPVDSRSDIYSLGVMFYELLTNSLPYNLKTDNEFEIMQAITNQIPNQISSIRKDIPQSISDVISKACQKDPDFRFPDCKDFEDAILDNGFKLVDQYQNQTRIIEKPSYDNRTVYNVPDQLNIPDANIKSNKNGIIIIGVISLLVIASILFYFLNKDNSTVVVVNNEKSKSDLIQENLDDIAKEQEKKLLTNQPEENYQSNQNKKNNYNDVLGDYPEGSVRYLNEDDVRYKTKYELSIMRNEIFARHGYIFKTNKDMINYFGKLSWYNPQYDDVTKSLSDIENYNIKFIKRYEN